MLVVTLIQFRRYRSLSLATCYRLWRWKDKAKDSVKYLKSLTKNEGDVSHIRCSFAGQPMAIDGYHDGKKADLSGSRSASLSCWSYNIYPLQLKHASNIIPIGELEKERTGNHVVRTTTTLRPDNKKKQRKLISPSVLKEACNEARELILRKTGQTTSELAQQCFNVGQKYSNCMPWNTQMDIALKCSLDSFKR